MSCQEAIFHCPLCGRHLTAYVNLTHGEATKPLRPSGRSFSMFTWT